MRSIASPLLDRLGWRRASAARRPLAARAIRKAGSALRQRLGRHESSGEESTRHDRTTGLLTGAGFDEALDLEIERARRTGEKLSVVVGELDRPASARAGALGETTIAALLREGTRRWDSVARLGHERFAVLAPATDTHGAYAIAERTRVALERALVDDDHGPRTVSFGIAGYPVHGRSRECLVVAADQALIAARQLGPNRSVISSAEVPEAVDRGDGGASDAQVELANLLALAEALDVRAFGSPTHCQRAGRYSELIARELGLSPEAIERVRIAGVLHDVGRLAVPDELLARAGPLKDDDWRWIRVHPEVGARLLETTQFGDIAEWIRAHHERPDGTGYPAGRGAGDVPLEAAILAVADAYEAMTSRRPYRPPLEPAEASQELRTGAGRQFDERVVDALLRVV